MSDDHQVAKLVVDCLYCMRQEQDSKTKLTACYNLTSRILRLFCVLGEKEDVLNLIDQFNNELKKEIEEMYTE